MRNVNRSRERQPSATQAELPSKEKISCASKTRNATLPQHGSKQNVALPFSQPVSGDTNALASLHDRDTTKDFTSGTNKDNSNSTDHNNKVETTPSSPFPR